MPSLAHRLLPVITVATGVGVGMTGVLGQAAQAATHVSRVSQARALDLSARVSAIPGARHPAGGRATIVASQLPGATGSAPAKLTRLLQADVLMVAGKSLPAALLARLRHVNGVAAAVPVDAGRIKVNGVFVNVLGVNPATFRPFAAGPTARSAALWRNVAAGGMAVSYTMGHQDKLKLTKPVTVDGARSLKVPLAGFGTVGIGGVDAVVSDAVARKLGLPASNAIVISAPKARLDHWPPS